VDKDVISDREKFLSLLQDLTSNILSDGNVAPRGLSQLPPAQGDSPTATKRLEQPRSFLMQPECSALPRHREGRLEAMRSLRKLHDDSLRQMDAELHEEVMN
jgi:hypothetical protein